MSASTRDPLLERRKRLRLATDVFGFDFVEVCHAKQIRVHLYGRVPAGLNAEHLFLRESANSCQLELTLPARDAHSPPSAFDLELTNELKKGVEYTLGLAEKLNGLGASIDPIFAEVSFRHDHSAIAPADCQPSPPPRAPAWPSPELNYLAKDYTSFRQLLLDRLAVTMPDWRERNPADIGIMLVEVLAYVADHLSYLQDAVGTEAYLATCRLRTSLRRHARLIDYRIHEGCNSRAWVHLEARTDAEHIELRDLYFQSIRKRDPAESYPQAIGTSATEFFEPVVSGEFPIRVSHNECHLYDWGGARPCLPAGASSAMLIDYPPTPANAAGGTWLRFKADDVLLFEEVRGTTTGAKADADPTHRHIVRLTSVVHTFDPLIKVGANKDQPLPLLEIHWHEADALPYTVWVGLPGDDPDPSLGPATVVRGNIVLVDHGRRQRERVMLEPSHPPPPVALAEHYPPATIVGTLAATDLTFSDNLPLDGQAASVQLRRDPRTAVPQLLLRSAESRDDITSEFSWLELRDLSRIAGRIIETAFQANASSKTSLPTAKRKLEQTMKITGTATLADAGVLVSLAALRHAIADDLRNVWFAKSDLLDSTDVNAHFVVEMTDERQARLRFGAHGFGRIPLLAGDPARLELIADFRTGNGTAGNVPAEAIDRVLTRGTPIGAIRRVRNPLAAEGGVDPEPASEIRQFAPHALRFQLQRAISPADYEAIAMKHFGDVLQKVRAKFHWNGHEVEVAIAVDLKGRERADTELIERIQATLEPFRRIGHEVHVSQAERVVPQLKLSVCLGPRVLREQIRQELDELFSNRVRADGTLAFFHPDRLSFADGLFISQIVAAAAGRPGILHLEVAELHRRDEGPAEELATGVLPLRSGEIIRFDNDPRHPEFGQLDIELKGGI